MWIDPTEAASTLATPGGLGIGSYLWAFGQGVLVDLTPCVYPLIPITVSLFGARGVSRPRAMALAGAYVLGMAVVYTSLGILVAHTGASFGAWLAEPLVVFPISLLLLALAASMFGAFDLQLPTPIQTRLGGVGGAGPIGAFAMGLVSGCISAPCTGPVLLSLLAFIAQRAAAGTGVLAGGSLLFVYALGMGTLFFAVAMGASLLRPGAWMEAVKSVFGIALVVMAVWFLRPLHPALAGFVLDPRWGLWAGLVLVAAGIAAGAVRLGFDGPWREQLRKSIAVAVTVLGAVLTINNMLWAPAVNWRSVSTVAELEAVLHEAEAEGEPILIDFAAVWCLPCKELELQTFHDPEVEPLLASDFTLIRVDVSEPDDERQLLQRAFDSETLPSVVLYDSNSRLTAGLPGLRAGRSMPDPTARFRTFVDAQTLMAVLTNVR